MSEASEGDEDEFQALLDGIGGAVRARDFEAFKGHMAFPITVITAAGNEVIAGTDDLHAAFEGYLAALDARGVTDSVRMLVSATRVSPALAACTYESHLLRHGARVVEPIPSAVMLRREAGGWRATSFLLSITHDRWRFRLPGSGGGAAP